MKAMNCKPILFNAEMVRAILDGSKTQTRRVIKQQPTGINPERVFASRVWHWFTQGSRDYSEERKCKYGDAGDRLWLRETFKYAGFGELDGMPGYNIRYRADDYYKWFQMHREDGKQDTKWRPSIFMPRWASRITLEITDVFCQRIQEISEDDAFAEGISGGDWLGNPVGEFEILWDSINKKRGYGWEKNPWVWVVEFKRVGGDL